MVIAPPNACKNRQDGIVSGESPPKKKYCISSTVDVVGIWILLFRRLVLHTINGLSLNTKTHYAKIVPKTYLRCIFDILPRIQLMFEIPTYLGLWNFRKCCCLTDWIHCKNPLKKWPFLPSHVFKGLTLKFLTLLK